MRILIIGGTGNISFDAAKTFLNRGDEVTVLTRGNAKAPIGCKQLRADRNVKDEIEAAIDDRSFDAAVNFLGFTKEQCALDYGALRGKVGQYVFISSATVYEKPHKTLPISEGMALGNKFSEYARLKIGCEDYLRKVHGEDFPVTIVRPSHTFSHSWIPSPLHGSGDWTVASRILEGKPIVLHDKGQSLWTLTASSDFAAGLAGLVGNEKAVGEVFHITSDEVLTWNEIYLEIGRVLGKEPKFTYIPTEFLCKVDETAEAKLLGDKAEHGVFDNRKIKRFVPKFACEKPFRKAIRESVAWYKANPVLQKKNAEVDGAIDHAIQSWRTQSV